MLDPLLSGPRNKQDSLLERDAAQKLERNSKQSAPGSGYGTICFMMTTGVASDWALTLKNILFPIFCKQCGQRLLTDENGYFCPTCWEMSPKVERHHRGRFLFVLAQIDVFIFYFTFKNIIPGRII